MKKAIQGAMLAASIFGGAALLYWSVKLLILVNQ